MEQMLSIEEAVARIEDLRFMSKGSLDSGKAFVLYINVISKKGFAPTNIAEHALALLAELKFDERKMLAIIQQLDFDSFGWIYVARHTNNRNVRVHAAEKIAKCILRLYGP